MANHTNQFQAAFGQVALSNMDMLRSLRALNIEILLDASYNYSVDAYKINGKYVLTGIKCKWGHMPGKEYILKYAIKEIGGVEVDSVIMKQTDGVEMTIYSLSEVDCDILGIEYEDGLQIFHKDMDFKYKRGQNIDINPKDLSTYPVSKETLGISKMHFILKTKEPLNVSKHTLQCKFNDILENGNTAKISLKHIRSESVWNGSCSEDYEYYIFDMEFSIPYGTNDLKGKTLDDLVTFCYSPKDRTNTNARQNIMNNFQYTTHGKRINISVPNREIEESVNEVMSEVDDMMNEINKSITNNTLWQSHHIFNNNPFDNGIFKEKSS